MNQSSQEDLTRRQQIERFLNSHKKKSQLNDISVKDMRHNIPLLLMEVHSDRYGHYTKKVKGLWEKRPDDWPAGVPFVDPNNKLKNEGEKNCKPKKELLGQMLNHLIERYKEKEEIVSDFKFTPATPSLSDPFLHQAQINLMESDESSLGLVADLLNQGQLMLGGFSWPSGEASGSLGSLDQSFPMLDFSSQAFVSMPDQEEEEEPTNPPEQAMDNEDGNMEDWEPLTELLRRIQQRLRFMKKKNLLSFAEFQSMEVRYNRLKEASLDLDPADCSVIDDLHALEKDIDKLRFSSRTSLDRTCGIYLDKTSEFLLKPDESENETVSKCTDADPFTDPCTEPLMEVSVGVEDPALMTSLNIKTRHGGPQPSGTVSNLSLRSMTGLATEVQSAGALKTSALSDCCKPVQPVEDDIQMMDEFFQNLQPLELPSAPIEDVMSVLNISDYHEAEARMLTPVQETDVESHTTSNAGKVSANTPPQLMYPGVGGQGMEGGHVLSFSPTGAPNTITISPAELFQLLMQQSGSTLTLAAAPQLPVTAQRKPFSTGLQPQATNRGKEIKPSGKRCYPVEDDDDDVVVVEPLEAAPNRFEPKPESVCGTLIPTMVEEMSDKDASSSRFSRKYRRTT